MSGRVRQALVLAALLVSTGSGLAAPPPPGAASCSGCHAAPARGDAAVPPLSGRSAEAIAAVLLAFRRGEGAPTVMDRIARGFTEDELRAIADWAARQ